eukprot:5437601-Prymnesium_polylepis.2
MQRECGVVDLLGAPTRHEVLDIEEDAKARADLAAALLDELADVLAEWPGVREEQVEARRRLELRQVGKFLLVDRRQLEKVAFDVS